MMSNQNRWTARDDDFGFPCAIEFDGITMLHIVPGTVVNAEHLNHILDRLNASEEVEALREEVESLRESYEPVPAPRENWWECIVGPIDPKLLTGVHDAPMRDAVKSAFKSIGSDFPKNIFSGWGAAPTETQRAVLENRLPRSMSKNGE